MAITSITDNGGAFTKADINTINANFTSLSGSTAGGTLTSAHLLVGDGSNVATDTAITGDVGITNAGVTDIASGVTTRKLTSGVAAGYKIARGSTALDGSNPTTVATGLTTVVSFTATLLRTTSLASGTAFLTHDTASGANVDVYGWVVAGTASTGTETFEWIAVGT